MTTRTWIGGGNNRASNPLDWSPTGAPQPGDTLTITSGTMNVTGNQLPSSDPLNVDGSPTIDIRHGIGVTLEVAGGDPTINIHNSAGVNISTFAGGITVNTTGHNEVDISGRPLASSFTINNTGILTGSLSDSVFTLNGGTFSNIGPSIAGFDGQMMFINADVVGNGTFELGSGHSPGFGELEFTKSVGAGQTISMTGGIGFGLLEVDQPKTFSAAIDFQSNNSVIDLNGLAADSYTYADDMLTFYKGSKVTDTLRFTATNPNFAVAQGTHSGGSGVEIYSTNNSRLFTPPGPDLPLHT